MKMIDDPRLRLFALQELANDPRTFPLIRHYRTLAVAERASCDPIELPAYDGLVARLDAALAGAALVGQKA